MSKRPSFIRINRKQIVRHAVETFEARRLLAAAPVLVGDINRTTDQLGPGAALTIGNVAYFAGRQSNADGPELFKTDGTTAGTVLVKDINPATGSEPDTLTNVNGTLYFNADDGVNGRELWKSDGTTAGTARVTDLNPGTASSSPTLITNVNGVIYFTATDGGSSGITLWRSDGTAAGTSKVTLGGTSATLANIRELVAYNGNLILTAGSSSSSRVLYRVEAGGSVATAISGSPTNPLHLTAFNGAVYFNVSGSTSVSTNTGDLWKTDGTTAGTVLVKAINYLSGSTDLATVGAYTVSGDRLYFTAGNVQSGANQLWSSDGTTAGTQAILSSNYLYSYTTFVPVGLRSVVFANITAAAGTEPWVSDGTVAGTKILKDTIPGTGLGADGNFAAVSLGNGKTLFTESPAYGVPTQIWTTDGTLAGTTTAASISAPGVAYPIGTLNGYALIAGIRYFGQGDLYRSNGTAAGTTRVGATLPGNSSSLDNADLNGPTFTVDGDTVYFAADDGVNGYELWKSVRNAAPVKVTQLAAPGIDAYPSDLTVTDDGTLYFTAVNDNGVRGIYRLPVGSTNPINVYGQSGTSPWFLEAVGNQLYFTAYVSATSSRTLYRYSPTSGTASSLGLAASELVKNGAYWYFGVSGYSSSLGSVQQIYRVDTTASATPQLVVQIASNDSTAPQPIVGDGTTLYFTASTAAAGTELWNTDGTAAGTAMVADLSPGTGSTNFEFNPANLPVISNGYLYFQADTNYNSDTAFYRTDGTAAGTAAISGVDGGFQPITAGGQTYFIGTAGNRTAIYRVDGTSATAVFTSAAGDNAFVPSTLLAAGNSVYAVGTGGNKARWELWSGDTSFSNFAKTLVLGPRVAPPAAGPLGGYFVLGRFALTASATDLYFPMYTTATDVEPYRLPLFSPPVAVISGAATVVEGSQITVDGSQSTSSSSSLASYAWDFNYDGTTFDTDATGASPIFNAGSIDGPASRTIALRVTDANGGVSLVTTETISITNAPPTAHFDNFGYTTVGQPNGFGFSNATDPATADRTSLTFGYDFNNDGDFTDPGEANDARPSIGYVFPAAGSYTVHGRVTDKDGGYTDYYQTAVVVPQAAAVDTAVTIEAETGTFTGGTAKSSSNTGYTGTGYADFAGQNSSAQWALTRPSAGPATITFRYANGGTANRPLTIYVNGASVGTLAFAPTGSWTKWTTVSISASLLAGSNTIKAVASSSVGGANVDSLIVAGQRPAWLSTSSDSAYTLGNGVLTVTGGTVTLLSDAGAAMPGLSIVVAYGNVVANTSQHLGTLAININSKFMLAVGKGKLLRVSALAIDTGGIIDLTDSDLILDYSTTASQENEVVQQIKNGRGTGTWTGRGITSSTAHSDATRTLGSASGADLLAGGQSSFDGETIDATSVVVKSTYSGDANLDGKVDFNDFLRLQSNFGATHGSFIDGDMNFDGIVDFNDFLTLQANFGKAL